jgi:hypothetical protein
MNESQQYTEDEVKLLLNQQGSQVISDGVPYVTTVDPDNSLSSWVVVPASKPKISYEEVRKAIKVEVSELKPNIPTANRTFISQDSYNALLSQSIQLNRTIDQLKTDISNLNTRTAELEVQTDFEVNQRLSLQQTNTVLVNQLTSLSDTIQGFGAQISTAVQKSVEESIYRTSLQAQNEGFKAQIQSLISQADSLNAIITGLYAQLGAAQIQQDVENSAAQLATNLQGLNINNVVVSRTNLTTYVKDGITYEYHGKVRNTDGNFKWYTGGDLIIRNVNNLNAKIEVAITYPLKGTTVLKFFDFANKNFTIGPKQEIRLTPIFKRDDMKCKLWADWGDGCGLYNSKTTIHVGGKISVTVKVENLPDLTKSLNLSVGDYHRDSY